MIRPCSLAATVALAGTLGACTTYVNPPPVLQYAVQGCAATPSLASPIGLTPDRERGSHVVATAVDANTACVERAGLTPYLVYALPTDFEDKTITVGGVLEGMRIFAPNVAVLDSSGMVSRVFQPDDYFYRGTVYSVQFRPRAGETYLLVTADPALVGRQYDSVAISTSTTSVYAGGVMASWTSGVDQQQARTFSYHGTVQVTVSDSDTEEGS